MTVQRVYVYLVSAAALVLLAIGLAVLGATILLFVFKDPRADSNRGILAISAAMSVIALPLWQIHFQFGQRLAKRDPYERRSAIRRVYLYFACLLFAVAALVLLPMSLYALLRPMFSTSTIDGEWAAQDGWLAALFVAISVFHFCVAARDRSTIHGNPPSRP